MDLHQTNLFRIRFETVGGRYILLVTNPLAKMRRICVLSTSIFYQPTDFIFALFKLKRIKKGLDYIMYVLYSLENLSAKIDEFLSL